MTQTAKQITSKAKSNLAITLLCLPKARRYDMVCFYAFCRIIDDIADSLILSAQEKERQLDLWHHAISEKQSYEELGASITEMIDIIDRYQLNPEYLLEIIVGCKSDIPNNQRFATLDDLQQYTYRVASCVGLVSIKIFGCEHPDSDIYANKLGHALQLTNILRDVGQDLSSGGRIYLPQDKLDEFNVSDTDLRNKKHTDNFIQLMKHLSDIAEKFYQEAVAIIPDSDRKHLKAAESMRKIYYTILQKMKADNFQVFTKTYKVSKLKKIYHLLY